MPTMQSAYVIEKSPKKKGAGSSESPVARQARILNALRRSRGKRGPFGLIKRTHCHDGIPDTMRRQVGQWLGNEATIGMVVLDREKGCERQNMKG